MFGAISDMLSVLGDMFNDLGTAIGYQSGLTATSSITNPVDPDLVDNGAATPVEVLINVTLMPVLDYAGALTSSVSDVIREMGEMLSSF